MESFWAWFRWLHDATGINLTIFYDPFDRGRFVSGFWMTRQAVGGLHRG